MDVTEVTSELVPNHTDSDGTWASGSDFTGEEEDSAWTDGSTLLDRSSRRALILQMAKARMKKETIHDEKKADASDFDLTGDLD
jgi:hypothetical protein